MTKQTLRSVIISLGVIAPFFPMVASAHTRPRPSPDTIWQAWYVDPLIAIPMLLASWLYLRGVRNLWVVAGRKTVITNWQKRSWLIAMASLAVALFSPVDALGGALFSVHMVQHLILFVVTPWLLAYSRPAVGIWWGLPAHWRSRIGQKMGGRGLIRQLHAFTQSPIAIVVVFTSVLWLWHTPALYDAALRSDVIHAVEHLSFMAGAYLLWSWLLSVQLGFGHRGGSRHGLAILIVFATVMQSGLLGAILTFSRTPLYEMHEGYSRIWGFTVLEDQQLAGLLMWVPMGMTFTVVALLLFRAWLIAADKQARLRNSQPGPMKEAQP